MYEWASVAIGDLTCVVDTTWQVGETTMLLNTTLGLDWAGQAYANGNVFEYTKSEDGVTLYILRWLVGGLENIAEGIPIRPYDGTTDLHGWPLRKIALYRKPGRPQVTMGSVYTSQLDNPTYPDANEFPIYDGNNQMPFVWEEDWQLLATLNAQSNDGGVTFEQDGPIIISLANTRRAQHVMVKIDAMESDFYAALNEIVITIDQLNEDGAPKFGAGESSPETEPHEDEGQMQPPSPGEHRLFPITAGSSESSLISILRHLICTEFGLPTENLFIEQMVNYTVVNQSLSQTSIAKALDALARTYGFWVIEHPNCRISVVRNPWYSFGAPTVLWEWDRNSISEVTPVSEMERIVAQVKVIARDSAGMSVWTAYHPSTADAKGEIVTVTDVVAQNQYHAQSLAKAEFVRLTDGAPVELTAVGPAPWVQVGSVHKVYWNANYAWPRHVVPRLGSALYRWTMEANIIVTGVSHELDFGQENRNRSWTTTLSGMVHPTVAEFTGVIDDEASQHEPA
jgi:hypothetical protein